MNLQIILKTKIYNTIYILVYIKLVLLFSNFRLEIIIILYRKTLWKKRINTIPCKFCNNLHYYSFIFKT